ncbi:hypothetical protein EPN44_01395 [bacterium]|nr:MAG: hypothetical protein EPN44_01395 [bacterium]
MSTRPRKIYLLHFCRPFGHAEHYLGSTDHLSHRLRKHARGEASTLVRHVVAAGIPIVVADVREGDRTEERRLKNRGGSKSRHCPICRGELTLEQAMRRIRANRILESEGVAPVADALYQLAAGA